MQQEKPGTPGPGKGSKSQGLKARSVAFQALLMSLGTLASRVLGLAREVLFAALFDRHITDAWYAAFRLPNVFRRLFGEGALAVSFIPVFVEAEADSPERARNLVNAFYTMFLILLATLTTIGIVWPEPFFRALLDEAFIQDFVKYELALQMGRIMFGYIFLVCTYAYFMAILNSLGSFGLPAFAPTLFNVAMIVSTIWPGEWTEWNGQALAWGVIVGGVLQLAILFPSLIRRGFLPVPSFDFRNGDVLRVLKVMGPSLAGLSLLQITTLVNLRFASSLGEGPITYLNQADRLMELPLSLVSVSIGAALLPTLSRLAAEKKKTEMIAVMADNFRLNLFISLGAAIGLFVLARPIVELLFERGRFTPQETAIVTSVVRIYAAILVFTSSIRVFVPGFYAIKNTWAPALISCVGLALHIGIAPILMERAGLNGLNFSTLLSLLVNWCLLVIAYRYWVGVFPWIPLFKSVVHWVPSFLVLFFGLQIYPFLREFFGDGFGAKILCLGLTMTLGLFLFAAAAQITRVPEFEKTWSLMKRKLNRKRAL